MKQQNLFFGTALLGVLSLSIATATHARPYPADFEFSVAQGDGDPTELTADELAATENAESDVAQLTAEGDFIVPTYLLPTESEMVAVPMPTVAVTPTQPVVQNEPIAPVFEVQPQTPTILESNQLIAPVVNPQEMYTQPTVESERVTGTIEKKPLLLPLAPIAQEETDQTPNIQTRERRVVPSALADTLLNNLEQNTGNDFLLPHEIKVSFYKNATALSGQTLKWIKAFALQTIQDPRLVVEIRMSQTDPVVQARRLAVIKNALLGTGLSTHQILVSYTKRPADSFVMRAIPKIQDTEISQKTTASGKTIEKRTIKW